MNNQFCSVVLFDTSSGVGRTWVFISLSILMDQLESEDVVNIYQTVKKLKYQRAEMQLIVKDISTNAYIENEVKL